MRWFPSVPDAVLERTRYPPKVHRTADGRALAYDVYGPARGRPCFWFHGSPSGRFEGLLVDELAATGLHRFVVVDRPGIGGSDPCPGWTMGSFAEDILGLADALNLARFSVAGGSGGGPFVLALSAFAPERIDRAVSLACAGAFEHPEIRDHIGWVDRLGATAAKRPTLIKTYFQLLGLFSHLPEGWARLGGQWLSPGGEAGLAVLFLRTLKESLRSGPDGVTEDTLVLHRAWGFRLEEIQVPVIFVNGTRDGFVPFAYGQSLATCLPKGRLITAHGDDHYRTIFDLERLHALLTSGADVRR